MIKEPSHQIRGEMSSQIIQHQKNAQRGKRSARRMPQPGFPTRIQWSLLFRRQGLCGLVLLDLREHGAELFLKPGMQHSIRSRGHPFGSQLSSGWTEEGEQF